MEFLPSQVEHDSESLVVQSPSVGSRHPVGIRKVVDQGVALASNPLSQAMF